MARLIERSEALLLGSTIVFQLVSFLTLLRVATGIASTNPTSPNPPAVVVPTSLNQSVVIPSSTPQFVNPVGSGLNASFLLVVLFVAANIAVISILAQLYRKKKMKWFSVVVSVFLVFNVTDLYFSFLLGLLSIIPILVAIAGSIVTIICAFYGFSRAINWLALLLALELGGSFPVLLQTPLNWIVPAAYSIFDIYAIYFGRLGTLVKQVSAGEKTQEELKGRASSTAGGGTETKKSRLGKWPDFGLLTINFGNLEIGMADIAFYTMVPAVALILVSLLAFIVVMLVLDIGLVISFYVFRNKEVSPGLPIPILLGLGALLLMYLLS